MPACPGINQAQSKGTPRGHKNENEMLELNT